MENGIERPFCTLLHTVCLELMVLVDCDHYADGYITPIVIVCKLCK